jgi:hypothetical protein
MSDTGEKTSRTNIGIIVFDFYNRVYEVPCNLIKVLEFPQSQEQFLSPREV